jgi:transposase-like protein
MRNLLARVPKSAQALVAATVRTIFEQPARTAAAAQLLQVVEALQVRFPTVVQLLLEAKELKRRSAVVGIFPNLSPSRGCAAPVRGAAR